MLKLREDEQGSPGYVGGHFRGHRPYSPTLEPQCRYFADFNRLQDAQSTQATDVAGTFSLSARMSLYPSISMSYMAEREGLPSNLLCFELQVQVAHLNS